MQHHTAMLTSLSVSASSIAVYASRYTRLQARTISKPLQIGSSLSLGTTQARVLLTGDVFAT